MCLFVCLFVCFFVFFFHTGLKLGGELNPRLFHNTTQGAVRNFLGLVPWHANLRLCNWRKPYIVLFSRLYLVTTV